jgi:hypothetical protein
MVSSLSVIEVMFSLLSNNSPLDGEVQLYEPISKLETGMSAILDHQVSCFGVRRRFSDRCLID